MTDLIQALLNPSVTVEEITTLIADGVDVNATDENGDSVLHYAAELTSNPELISALIEAGADVNAADEGFGNSVLHSAVEGASNPEVISVLIEAGADVNATNQYGCTALHRALRINSNLEVISTLIKGGADVNATDIDGRTPLHEICEWYDEPEPGDEEPTIRSTPQEVRIEMSRLLLESGANINAQTTNGPNPDEPWDNNKITPLKNAVGPGSINIVKYLLSMGANPNIQDELKRTPLVKAIFFNDQEMVEILLEGGADINCTFIHFYDLSTGEPLPVTFELNGVDGETNEIYPLDLAVMEEHQELSSYLLSVGAKYTPGLTQLEMSIGLKDGVTWADIGKKKTT